MAYTVDERQHFAALQALAVAALNAGGATWQVFDLDKVPSQGSLPEIFAVLEVERRYIESQLLAPRPFKSGWRVIANTVGTSLDEARWAQLQIAKAFEYVTATVNGTLTTPLEWESGSSQPDYSEERWSLSSVWTYIH